MYGIFGREGVVGTAGIEVFLCDGVGVESPGTRVAGDSGVGRGKEGEVRRYVGINRVLLHTDSVGRFHGASGAGEAALVRGRGGLGALEQAGRRVRRWHGVDGSRGAALAEPFIVEEEEGLIRTNGATDGPAELVALERRGASGEIVLGVEGAVADELVSRAVKFVGAFACDGRDDPTRGAAVVGSCVGGDDGELLNCVDAEGSTQRPAGTGAGVIVSGDAVETIVVLLRASAADRDLRANAAVGAGIVACGDAQLVVDGVDIGLEDAEGGPVTPVQRKLAECLAIDGLIQLRGAEIDGGRSGGHVDDFSAGSRYLQLHLKNGVVAYVDQGLSMHG